MRQRFFVPQAFKFGNCVIEVVRNRQLLYGNASSPQSRRQCDGRRIISDDESGTRKRPAMESCRIERRVNHLEREAVCRRRR